MGSVKPNSISSCCLRMNLVYSLALVLPAFVFVWGSSTDNPALSFCDPDLLPCTDKGDNICDCPSEEQSREDHSRKDRNRRSGALKGKFIMSNLWKNCDAGSSCTIRHQDVLDEINKLRGINKGLRMLIRDATLEERAEELANQLPCNLFDQGGIFDLTMNMNWGEVMTGAPGVKMVWNSLVEIMSQQHSRIGIGITSNCQRFLPPGVHAWKAVALFARDYIQ